MNRRDFLKSALSAAALAAIPAPLLAAFEAGEIDTISHKGVEITYPENGEWGMVVNGNGNSMEAVYDALYEAFNGHRNNPVIEL